MAQANTRLYDALAQVIGTLGQDGGLISPSVYDTAQLLRFQPPQEGVTPAITWLKAQQSADGGWGDPAVPLARDIPTLAAILALQQYSAEHNAYPHIAHGLAFLRNNAAEWLRAHIDLLPIAAEMILPRLLADAAAVGLVIDTAPYAELYALAAKKRAALTRVDITAGSAPTYSWEALDRPFDPSLIDGQGSIGHSPAATAYWLHQAANADACASSTAVARARTYLAQAAASTQTGIPGVVPTVWPLESFDYLYALYACVQNGLHRDPAIAPLLGPAVAIIHELLNTHGGLGFSPDFIVDVDCTGVGVVGLAEFGHTSDPGVIMAFHRNDHFFTYAYELNPSTFSNAHAMFALNQLGIARPDTVDFVVQSELPEGGWRPDKWHSSWIYTSMEVCYALRGPAFAPYFRRLVSRLLAAQHEDGAWYRGGIANLLDTSYAVMTLRLAAADEVLDPAARARLQCAESWLLRHAQASMLDDEYLWMGKELYSPRRVDQAYVLSTLWAVLHAPTCSHHAPTCSHHE